MLDAGILFKRRDDLLKGSARMPNSKLCAALFLSFMVIMMVFPLYASDGIPDNCETASGDRIHIFVRYEASTRRLILVDWASGADVQILATDLPDTIRPLWSPDCAYLALAVQAGTGWDTVVYDVAANAEVGRIPDARGNPHPLTWGPPPYLMVETRHGAYLWNVQQNTQIHITESFNTTTGRNFSRIRWDAQHQQVSVNLAVGGRTVYDMVTGQPVAEAAYVTDSIPDAPGNTGEIVIGGKAYECQRSTQYGYRNRFSAEGIAAVQVDFNPTSQTLFVRLRNHSSQIEALQMIEDHVGASYFRFMGWSRSCRYFYGYLGVPGQNASDTGVWDVVENRRIGTIPDARVIPHPVSSSTFDDALFVQTRSGGYLWHLPTNTQTSIAYEADIPASGRSYVRNVANYRWAAGQLWVQPLNAAETWDAYDVVTGTLVDTGSPSTPRTASSVSQTIVPPTPLNGENGYDRNVVSQFYDTRHRTCNDQALRYDDQTRSLLLVDTRDNGIIQIIEENLNLTRPAWSADCQWVYAGVDVVTNETQPYDNRPLDDILRDDLTFTVIVWDPATWQRKFVFNHPYKYEIYPSIRWSPGGDRAIVYTSNGSYLLNAFTGEQVLLTFKDDSGQLLQPHLTTTYWDYARGQVLINGFGVVYAFDLTSGVERYRFEGGRDYWHSRFSIQDNRILFIMGSESSSVWVWNLDTLDYDAVRLGSYWENAYERDRIALSPDQRYLVMGYSTVRVWDLTGEDFQRPGAYYRVPGVNYSNRIIAVTFQDETRLRVTLRDGRTHMMGVRTGEFLMNP